MKHGLAGRDGRVARPLSRPPALVALLLATSLVAGCGGSDKKDRFAKDFKPVNAQLVALGSDVGQALQNASSSSDQALAQSFQGFVVRLQGIKGRIEKLDPPSDLKSQVTVLSSSVSRLIVDLGGIVAAARAHDPSAGRAATAALVRDAPAAGDARRLLARKTGAPAGP
jgi:outer membrane murein-binding lipoprotein Lpp